MYAFILLFAALLSFTTPVFAEDMMSSTPSAGLAKSDYALPYPGILPDNPLYGLKMIRDKVVLLLINDPANKVKFDVLQADKRLAAGRMLWDKDHKNLDKAADTVSKGQNYFSQALALTISTKRTGKDTNIMENELMRSSQKHLEELQAWSDLLSNKDKSYVTPLIRTMRSYSLQLNNLKK